MKYRRILVVIAALAACSGALPCAAPPCAAGDGPAEPSGTKTEDAPALTDFLLEYEISLTERIVGEEVDITLGAVFYLDLWRTKETSGHMAWCVRFNRIRWRRMFNGDTVSYDSRKQRRKVGHPDVAALEKLLDAKLDFTFFAGGKTSLRSELAALYAGFKYGDGRKGCPPFIGGIVTEIFDRMMSITPTGEDVDKWDLTRRVWNHYMEDVVTPPDLHFNITRKLAKKHEPNSYNITGTLKNFSPNESGGIIKGTVKCSGALSYRIDGKSRMPYEGKESYSSSCTYTARRGTRSSTTTIKYDLTDTAKRPKSNKRRR